MPGLLSGPSRLPVLSASIITSRFRSAAPPGAHHPLVAYGNAVLHFMWRRTCFCTAQHTTRHEKGNATFIVSARGPFPALGPCAIPLADGTLQLRLRTVQTSIVTLCYVNLSPISNHHTHLPASQPHHSVEGIFTRKIASCSLSFVFSAPGIMSSPLSRLTKAIFVILSERRQ